MLEFIKENQTLLIIVGIVILTFLISLLLSFIVRKKQIKKERRMELQKAPDFKKYHVKVVNIEDIDISKAKNDTSNNNNDDNINIK